MGVGVATQDGVPVVESTTAGIGRLLRYNAFLEGERNAPPIYHRWNAHRWCAPQLPDWLTTAILPPRFKQFRDPAAVVDIIRSNVSVNDIYTAPQGIFAAISLAPGSGDGPRSFGARIILQFTTEFVVAFGLSFLVVTISIRSPLSVAGFLGPAGLIAWIETHFASWNWAGFPATYLLAGSGYLAANWFVVGLALGAARRKLILRTDAV